MGSGERGTTGGRGPEKTGQKRGAFRTAPDVMPQRCFALAPSVCLVLRPGITPRCRWRLQAPGAPALPQATRCAGEGSTEDRFSDPAGPARLRDAGDLQVYKPEAVWDPGVSTCTAVCGCTQAAGATFLLQAPTSGPGLGPPPSCSQARFHAGAGVPVSAAGVQVC